MMAATSYCSNCPSCLGHDTAAEQAQHCRRCGNAVCETCSPHRIQLTEGRTAERVCNNCVKVVSQYPQLLAQQRQIGTFLQLAGVAVSEGASLREAADSNLAASQALAVLSRRSSPASSAGSPPSSPPCEFFQLTEEPEAYVLDGLDTEMGEAWEDVDLDVDESGRVLDLRQCDAEKVLGSMAPERVAYSWEGLPGSVWMRPHEAQLQLLVQLQVHGCSPNTKVRVDFADKEGGQLMESVEAAVDFVGQRQRGTVQWMWGDVGLPGARFNPMRWSAHRDPVTTREHLRRYLHGKDASRKVRVLCVESHFLTLEEAITSLQSLRR